jgi:hypothetical protein
MRRTKLALTAFALMLACVLTSSSGMAAGTIVSKTKVIGNNVNITSTGGVTTVQANNSCSTGISGYLYQSVLVFFGGGVYSVTQSTTCP